MADQDIGHDHDHDDSGEPFVNEIEVRGLIVGAFQENCWVIGNRRTGEAICIDPGEQADDILHMASEMGVTIKLIANSHAHLDHVLGVRGVQSDDNATFLLHEADLDILQGAAESAARFGMQVEQPPDPDHYIDDEQKVEVDGVQLQVIHTPGHTARFGLLLRTRRAVLGRHAVSSNSIGRTDLPGGDYNAGDVLDCRQTADAARRHDCACPDTWTRPRSARSVRRTRSSCRPSSNAGCNPENDVKRRAA